MTSKRDKGQHNQNGELMSRGNPGQPRGMRKSTKPGDAAYKHIFRVNHYKEKGLSFEDFVRLSSQNCHYCNAPPRLVNPLGQNWQQHCEWYKKHLSYEGYQACFIYVNGIDKKEHRDDYSDLSNLVPCCWPCNQSKHRRSVEEFLLHALDVVLESMTEEML